MGVTLLIAVVYFSVPTEDPWHRLVVRRLNYADRVIRKKELMNFLCAKIIGFLKDENGPTTVEYAVLLAVIIIAAIGAVLETGDVQRALFFDTADFINEATQK